MGLLSLTGFHQFGGARWGDDRSPLCQRRQSFGIAVSRLLVSLGFGIIPAIPFSGRSRLCARNATLQQWSKTKPLGDRCWRVASRWRSFVRTDPHSFSWL